MAEITVVVYARLRKRLGFSRMTVKAVTVSAALKKLCAGDREAEAELLEPDGSPRKHFVLTLNSEVVCGAAAGETALSEGDILHIFPPVSGG